MRLNSRWLRRGVLPVCSARGIVGTASVLGPGLALTARHVVTPDRSATLWLGQCGGYPVASVERLSLPGCRRATAGPVDLALLLVPGLRRPRIVPRSAPAEPGEHLVVPGYPGGFWRVSHGPVTGVADTSFGMRMLLGPGASGSPALDRENRLVGVVTHDNESGTFCVGPRPLNAFLRQCLTPSH